MLCVTGKETSNQSLKQRIERTKARVKGCLQEVRLDALTHINDDTFSILNEFPKDLIVCCRPERQGGWFKDSEEDRLQILDRAARTGVAYLDVEADVPESRLTTAAAPGRDQADSFMARFHMAFPTSSTINLKRCLNAAPLWLKWP